jgi:hypothetical protein
MTTGKELATFTTGLNAEADIDATLLGVLIETAKTIIEGERPWMALRKIDTSLLLTTANTWQTAKSLAGITDFSRLFDDPITLFDGSNLTHDFAQVPFGQRLQCKNDSGTFGLVPFNGTLYLPYVSTSPEVDLTAETPVWTAFPSRFLPLLGFYAVGIFKGAVDYDTINKQMLPHNAAAFEALKNALVAWDDQLQAAALDFDPSGGAYPRSGAIMTR